MIVETRDMLNRHRFRIPASGALGVLTVLMLWGCASPPSTTSPSAPQASAGPGAPPTGQVPQSPSSPSAPGGMRPREQPTTASMVASAQWVEEASRAIDVGDYDRAMSLLEQAINVEPNNGRAFYYYGLAMGGRGRPGSALTLLQKAEILLQGDGRALGDVYAQMGINLERLGRRQEAIRRYEQALAQDPSNPLARRQLEALRG